MCTIGMLWKKYGPMKAEGKKVEKMHNKEPYDHRFPLNIISMTSLKQVNK